MRRVAALTIGLVCHALFLLGCGAMVANLFCGMRLGLGPEGWVAVPWNALLIGQFVVLHSALLRPAGRRLLRRLVPAALGPTLDTTLFATAASVQVGLLFGLWAPLPGPVFVPALPTAVTSAVLFLGALLLLTVAIWEASLGIHTGATGWTALWRGDRPHYPTTFPREGLHGRIRHPVYLSFLLLCWLGPVWSLDKLLVAVPLSLYCLRAPRRKEVRLAARYGDAWARYCAQTPAFLPRLGRLAGGGRAPAGAASGSSSASARPGA